MKPLIVLICLFLASMFIIKLLTQKSDYQLSAKIGICGMLLFTAIGHFIFTKGMALMVPPMIPFKIEIIYITGILEILLGFGLLVPSLSKCSGWILIVLFIILLPANIYASINRIDYEKATFDGNGLMYLWYRIPLQIFFIICTYLAAIKDFEIRKY